MMRLVSVLDGASKVLSYSFRVIGVPTRCFDVYLRTSGFGLEA